MSGRVMLGILACPTRLKAPPGAWEVFREEHLRSFLEAGLLAGLGLVLFAVAGALALGLFTRLPDGDRGPCAALPLTVGVATFVFLQLIADPVGDWWRPRNAIHDAVLPFAFTSGVLGLLVLGRRWFLRS